VTATVLVVAPHEDDEVLGAGGTMARFAHEGARVAVVVLTRGFFPQSTEEEESLLREEAARAHQILKVAETIFLDFPAAALDTVPHRDLNRAMNELYQRLSPTHVLIPFLGDIHRDHQAAFLSAMVMCRPNGGHLPRSAWTYETLSETNWNAPPLTPGFLPNTYIDITEYLETKIKAFQAYRSQIRPFPHERSVESLKALATLRGSAVHLRAAEAFVAVRNVI
jgi:LmbE family N-acetylglucosaminyl deacetylase